MMDRWWHYEGKWYQIWYPSSGPIGGAILAFVLFVGIYTIFEYV